MNWRYGGFAPYVSVGKRKSQGLAKAKKRIGKGNSLKPINISGRKIATTFWGQSWCKHFETYSDFSNRLPRGRTYARNGSIAHLEISSGVITAMVCGSDLYLITIRIDSLPKKAWRKLCDQCITSVHSVIDLMLGKLPDTVIESLTAPESGLFPKSSEIRLSCDCPDSAHLCKHLAAVLYGVGSRLDEQPELLFLLRGVQQTDLIGSSLSENADSLIGIEGASALNQADLGDIFGIDLVLPEDDSGKKNGKKPRRKRAKKTSARAPAKKKAVKKRAVKKKSAKKKAAKR
jgi:uncharacterized Zn finger protein